MAWAPLSQRDGRREPDGPFEGVPVHLKGHLISWVDDAISLYDRVPDPEMAAFLTNRFRVPLETNQTYDGGAKALMRAVEHDGDLLLDVVDALLYDRGSTSANDSLRFAFEVAARYGR